MPLLTFVDRKQACSTPVGWTGVRQACGIRNHNGWASAPHTSEPPRDRM